ncbi:MAG: preprotein translocase subunit SecA [bacterium]|nr:preprotein translocase subunit SecA [bacterium]
MNFLSKLFPSYNQRRVGEMEKIVIKINEKYNELLTSRPDDPKKRTIELKKRIQAGETLDDILIDAYALVKYVMKTLADDKHEYQEGDMKFAWEMVPYDVQLIGSIGLHQGNIVEMATGEGKTLVAVMPLFLNSLESKGACLVTVNDYLARRDRAWMKPVYDKLGVTVGLIQMGMSPSERRANYSCDVTYVTNNEFGFDYLRDNMAYQKSEKVHRDFFNFAIIDEVDSVLIDEARTPLIISGMPLGGNEEKRTEMQYRSLSSSVSQFVRAQKETARKIFEKSKKLYDEGNFDEAVTGFLSVKRAWPKMKEIVSAMQNSDILSKMEKMENVLIRDKMIHTLDSELLYSIEERSGAVTITDRGEDYFEKIHSDSDFFATPELSLEFKRIEDETEDAADRSRRKGDVISRYAEKSEYIHALHQLLKAHTLFEKDVEYIVQNGKIVIVDEHTGRLMPSRRFSEGLHSAIEAKENVSIQEETKTLATITLQNLFRMFSKLSGMTGTAETEAGEFMHIYKLPVLVIPTNKDVIRKDYNDLLFIRKEEKTKHLVEKILKIHNAGVPLLVGTASVQSSEHLDSVLKTKKNMSGKPVKYSILNARHHEQEANIIAEAGLQGAVTIATNMAGRGTDIKLGPTIKMLPERSALLQALFVKNTVKKSAVVVLPDETSFSFVKDLVENDSYLKEKSIYFTFEPEKLNDLILITTDESNAKTSFKITVAPVNNPSSRFVCISYAPDGSCVEHVPAGLFVLGTEKHESRRIDRQLRGRSGRQGDPGASLFTVSLEDDLMRVFGNEKMSDMIKRLEAISSNETSVSHRLLTTSIESAQKRIENLNFERRKYLLEYDDVINKQREIVYQLRNFFLERKPPLEFVDRSTFSQYAVSFRHRLEASLSEDLFKSETEKFALIMNAPSLEVTRKDVMSNDFEDILFQKISVFFEESLDEVKEYVGENIPPLASEFIISELPDDQPSEEWNIDRINEWFMNYFKIGLKKQNEETTKKQFAMEAETLVREMLKDKFSIFSNKELLLFNLCNMFIMSIDKLWIEQLYELDAIKEGISLRGYAQRDPLIEFKKEAYVLFNDLMDNIYKDFCEKFFSAVQSVQTKQDNRQRRIDTVKREIASNTPEEEQTKQKPQTREEKKIGRNDPCWCGSGKKYKNCHGKNV